MLHTCVVDVMLPLLVVVAAGTIQLVRQARVENRKLNDSGCAAAGRGNGNAVIIIIGNAGNFLLALIGVKGKLFRSRMAQACFVGHLLVQDFEPVRSANALARRERGGAALGDVG